MTALLERDIQKACEDILQLDGFRLIHPEQNYSERKRKRVGEAGAPDTLAIRYGWSHWDRASAEILWIEWKRPKGIASATQKLWHRAERERGAVVWVAGETFEPTYEAFKAYYEASGLCRRRLQ